MSILTVCNGDVVSYGLTVEDLKHFRAVMAFGLHHNTAMVFLKTRYEANKAIAERPLNYFDNVYNGRPFDARTH